MPRQNVAQAQVPGCLSYLWNQNSAEPSQWVARLHLADPAAFSDLADFPAGLLAQFSQLAEARAPSLFPLAGRRKERAL